MKNVTNEQMMTVVENLAIYMDYIALETSSPQWNNILFHFDLFFRRLPTFLPDEWDTTPVLKIMVGVLKIPGLTSVKVKIFFLKIEIAVFSREPRSSEILIFVSKYAKCCGNICLSPNMPNIAVIFVCLQICRTLL